MVEHPVIGQSSVPHSRILDTSSNGLLRPLLDVVNCKLEEQELRTSDNLRRGIALTASLIL